MPRIISEKKKAERSDGKQGRTKHQKLKSYIVTQYLLKNTDEDHLASALRKRTNGFQKNTVP